MSYSRLVTWNLFFSASAYERDEPISWEVIEDLSGLTDLLCLYDELRVLGDPEHPPFLTHQTEFFNAMRWSKAIDVRATKSTELDELIQLTRRHLRVFLPDLEDKKLDRWLGQALRLSEMPLARERVATMNARVRLNAPPALLSPTPDNIGKALDAPDDPLALRPFVIRTFMYLSYAELAKVPFAPDSSRSSLLDAAVTREGDLASQLRSRLSEQWEQFPTLGNVDLRRRVSPFAAVVLERCKGHRRAIPVEVLRLRDELRPVRERLGELEQDMLFGSRQKAVQTEQKWNAILSEIVQSFGPSPQLVTLTGGLGLAQKTAKILDDPMGFSAWVDAIATLSKTVLVRCLRRRPVAQLHKLRSELPAAGRLIAAVHSVFPETAQLPMASDRRPISSQ